jgi:hypothetical protein
VMVARRRYTIVRRPSSVTSELRRWRKWASEASRRRWGAQERQGCDRAAKPCAPSHGGAAVKSERGGAGNAAYPELGCLNGVLDDVERTKA